MRLTESSPKITKEKFEELKRRLEAREFRPARFLRNNHAQTIIASKLPRRGARLLRESASDTEARLFRVAEGVQILAHCRWQKNRGERPTAILQHGLEGSSASLYMLGTASKLFRAGFNTVRLNMRNCGGTEHLTPTLYHSGMSNDVRAVLEELIREDKLPEFYLAGYSMGGNIILKLAGEYADAAPPELKGVAAVSPACDLAAAADEIERRSNIIYQTNFVYCLKQRVRRKQKLFPEIYDLNSLKHVRTVREFDDALTAPHNNFKDAADYYAQCSAAPLIPRIAVPTLIIHAQDDPFIPFAPLLDAQIAANLNLILLAPARGGHVAFISDRSAVKDGEDRFWAENRIVEFFRELSER